MAPCLPELHALGTMIGSESTSDPRSHVHRSIAAEE